MKNRSPTSLQHSILKKKNMEDEECARRNVYF
jgi:hypothetical protein